MNNPIDSTNFADVGRFHAKFGLPSVSHGGPGPVPFDLDLLVFRIKFMLEELLEFIEASGLELHANTVGSVVQDLAVIPDPTKDPAEMDQGKMFDALLDEAYVVFGTAHLLGYPWQEGWNAVQTANMAKVRAKEDGSDSLRGSAFDVVKPEGWTPPDIDGILRRHGFHTYEQIED